MRIALVGLTGVLLVYSAGDGAVAAEPHSIVSEVTGHRERAGQCFRTRVQRVRERLQNREINVAGSGSEVILADGHENVSYKQVPAIDRSKPGDPVRLCVRNLPAACPPGDNRGIVYRGENLRTHMKWEASDSAHPCGGA
jgi:hypothetical protein